VARVVQKVDAVVPEEMKQLDNLKIVD